MGVGTSSAAAWSEAGAGRSPIRHVVVIIKENHTFDQMFGDRALPHCSPLSWLCLPSRARALRPATCRTCACRYPERILGLYRDVASRFALASHHFTEVRGPSCPNHFMLMAAQAPCTDDPPASAPPPDLETLADRVAAAGLTWRNYAGRAGAGFAMVAHLRQAPENRPWEQFEQDCRTGDLPNLAWVTPPFAQSEHPPTPVGWGEAWTLRQLTALWSGPAWKDSVAFVLWDDWGGFADHVPPPTVELRDGAPFRYGLRCPVLIVSPFARAGLRYGELTSHVSIPAFCESVFSLAPLTERDAAANPFAGCFDWENPRLDVPAVHIPGTGLLEHLLSPVLDWAASVLD